jgi:integrase
MALKLYRRHRKECEGGHHEDARTGQFEEGRRGWKRCACLIHVAGTLGKKFNRRQTGETDWERARAFADACQKAGSWDGEINPPPQPLPEPSSHRVAVSTATKTFLDELQETAAFATHKKYRLLMARLNEFSEQRGYVMIDQWEPIDVREFRSTWPLSPQTAVRRMAMLKPFFEYCVSNKWIQSNPARSIKNPKGREMSSRANEQKLPFTDDEIKKMYEACQRYGTTNKHKWNGDDVADFISLSIYTGLRISDVALFNVDRMLPNGEIRVRTTKAGTHVYTWVPKWLQDRIRGRAKKHGPHIFGEHTTKSLDVITELWRRKLNLVWEDCGKWRVKPTPHRFRHTFARILLQKPGVTVRDVAELLGNTEEMVLRRYSAWVASPAAIGRLVDATAEFWFGKPLSHGLSAESPVPRS